MDTCTRAANGRFGCHGSYLFKFDPGTGGPLGWRLLASNTLACNEAPASDGAERASGVIDVQTGITEAGGTVYFEWEAPNPRTVYGAPPNKASTAQVQITSGGTGGSPVVPYFSDYDCSTNPFG